MEGDGTHNSTQTGYKVVLQGGGWHTQYHSKLVTKVVLQGGDNKHNSTQNWLLLRDGSTQVYGHPKNIANPGDGRQAWTNTGYGSKEASQTQRL